MKSRQSVYRPVVAGVIVLFVLLVAAGFQLWRDYVTVRVDLTEAATAHARLVSENVERTTEAVDLVLSQVARRKADVDWKTLENSRRAWINLAVDAERLPQIRSLWFVDQNGRMRLFSDKFPTPDLDVFERDYFQAHGQGSPARLFIGRTRKGKFSGKDFFSVSYPILAGRYNFRGVVAAAMEPSYYLPLISTFDERCDACRVLLLRDAGEVLLSTEPSDVAPDAAVPLSALQHFATLEKPQSHTRLESDWTAVVEHPSIAPITVAVLVPD